MPSATEIVCALGPIDLLVGRSHECDYPAAVRRLPALTEPRFADGGTSAAIDGSVKALLGQALSIYRVDAARLAALAPDVVITQTQCDVCAVSLADVEAALQAELPGRPRIVALGASALADLWRDVARVAEAIDATAHGVALLGRLQTRLAAAAARARRRVARPTVACIEWLEPLMAAGNWVPELVALAGGRNLFGAAGQHSPWMSWEALLAADPDVVVLMPCGFDMARTRRELPQLAARAEWSALRAVRERRVFIADGNQYFNRPGPRLVESLELLVEMLHPDVEPLHRGVGWQPAGA